MLVVPFTTARCAYLADRLAQHCHTLQGADQLGLADLVEAQRGQVEDRLVDCMYWVCQQAGAHHLVLVAELADKVSASIHDTAQ